MKITWLGHSCFTLESEGYKIILDPFKCVRGFEDISGEVNGIYCSHFHFDHAYTDELKLIEGGENPFKITEVQTKHDPNGGTLRGDNTVRVFEAEGIKVCHLGDLGHELNGEQKAAIGSPDVLLIPVGGVYTIDPETAKKVAESLNPKVIIPMHYRLGSFGFKETAELKEFTSLFPDGFVKEAESNSFIPSQNMENQVLILKAP